MKQSILNSYVYLFFVLICKNIKFIFDEAYITAYSNNLKKLESHTHTHAKTHCEILMNGWLSILEGNLFNLTFY